MLKAQELSTAVTLILEGKLHEGMRELNEFEARNPESPLLASVRQAREKLAPLADKTS